MRTRSTNRTAASRNQSRGVGGDFDQGGSGFSTVLGGFSTILRQNRCILEGGGSHKRSSKTTPVESGGAGRLVLAAKTQGCSRKPVRPAGGQFGEREFQIQSWRKGIPNSTPSPCQGSTILRVGNRLRGACGNTWNLVSEPTARFEMLRSPRIMNGFR